MDRHPAAVSVQRKSRSRALAPLLALVSRAGLFLSDRATLCRDCWLEFRDYAYGHQTALFAYDLQVIALIWLLRRLNMLLRLAPDARTRRDIDPHPIGAASRLPLRMLPPTIELGRRCPVPPHKRDRWAGLITFGSATLRRIDRRRMNRFIEDDA
jgi:hypothetical protein